MKETRRINPIAHITTAVVVVLITFETLIIFGVFELKAQTVANYAPWAHESFLRWVGEHPDSAPRWVVEVPKEPTLDPIAAVLVTPTNETSTATNLMLKPIVPVVPTTNAPLAKPVEVIPVG